MPLVVQFMVQIILSHFSEDQKTDTPLSFYAATKISNEMMANSYSHIYSMPITGLRYFTVYGPWGRPDMAPMIFASNIFCGKPISVFNYGKMSRDFTYISDIVEGTFLCCLKPPTKKILLYLYLIKFLILGTGIQLNCFILSNYLRILFL